MKIGIDIGGTHIGIAVVDKDKVINKKEYIYDKEFRENIKEKLLNYIILTSLENMKNYEIEKIGISVAGRLENNVLKIAPNLPELQGTNFIEELSKYFNIPIVVNKDSFCAAKAEKEYGCLINYKTCVFLCIGTGIGAVSFRDNFLHRDGFRTYDNKTKWKKMWLWKKWMF